MQETQTYYKDGVARILELLKNALGSNYTYFNGEPEFTDTYLPCVMVSETTGGIKSHATGTDLITETIVITIALNKKDDILSTDPTIDLTEFKLRKLVKGQHPETGEYLPETVMFALRKHITMQDSILSSSITTDFDENVRGDDTITQEAYVTVTMERLAIIPSRD
jgi:hypothetical protein